MCCSPWGFKELDTTERLNYELPPRNLPDPGIELASLMSPALARGFFTTSATKAQALTPCVTLSMPLTCVAITHLR